MTHGTSRSKQLLEAYTIGALDPEELEALEQHLRTGCLECEEILKDLSEVSSHLALCIPQYNPSPSVKAKLLAEVKEYSPQSNILFANSSGWGWITAGIAAVCAFYLGIRTINLKQEVKENQKKLIAADDEISRVADHLRIVRSEKFNQEKISSKSGTGKQPTT